MLLKNTENRYKVIVFESLCSKWAKFADGRGVGVKNCEKFADVLNGRSLASLIIRVVVSVCYITNPSLVSVYKRGQSKNS